MEEMKTYDVIEIAKKIIAKTDIEKGDSITNLKLQKLLYYEQGFHLAYFDKPLFKEDIQAWMYGPVVPSVYEKYRTYGKRAIDVNNEAKVIRLKDEEETLFDEVYDVYNQYSATALVNMTHNETPWATSDIAEVISEETMKDFFKKKLK